MKPGDRVAIHLPSHFKPGRTGVVERFDRGGAWVTLDHNQATYWFSFGMMTVVGT